MKKFLLTTLFLLITLLSFAQTIFTETFNEGDGSTSGTDETGGVSWTSTCGACVSGDLWEEKNGAFHNQDSNGPALWTSNTIDISSCSSFEICFDYNMIGVFEACGTGCNSVDWVTLNYTLGDGMGASTPFSPSNSYYCSGGCADLNVVWDGSMDKNSFYCSDIITVGSNTELSLELGTQTWAGSEYMNIDNIEVRCPVPLTLDTTKINHQILKDITTPKIIMSIHNIIGKQLYFNNSNENVKIDIKDYTSNGVLIVRYTDLSIERVIILK